MRTLVTSLCLLLFLSGCGHMLASMEANKIEEDEGERTWGRMLEDDSVETKARVNIHAADDAFDDAHLNIVCFNGYVLLAGQVPSDALKSKATDVVREIRGVRRIYNELEVAAPSSGMTRSSDTWITAKLKSFMLANPEIEGQRIKVVTENGVVYLMGLVTREEAGRIAEEASDTGGVQKVVKLFELID